MARCKGTTRSGSRCKLDAQPGSDFCHLHGEADGQTGSAGGAEGESITMEDLVPLIVAGAAVAGVFLLMRTVGRWIPSL